MGYESTSQASNALSSMIRLPILVCLAVSLVTPLAPLSSTSAWSADHQALTARAVASLESRQNPDGSWGDRSVFRDTVEVVSALREAKPDSPSIGAGLSWLAAQAPSNDDFLARHVTLFGAAGSDVSGERALLLGRIKEGRSWGLTADYSGDLLTTLEVLRALQDYPGLNYQTRRDALAWVLSLQGADGGFAYSGSNESSVFLASEAIRVLAGVATDAAVLEAVDRVGRYLLAQLNPDGTVGGTLYEALAAADALRRTRVLTAEQRIAMYAQLASLQSVAGGFGTTAYETALAVRLFGAARANLSLDASAVTVSNATPEVGEKVALSVLIHNYGDAAAPNFSVRFHICSENADLGSLVGQVTVLSLEALATTTVSVDYTASSSPGVFNICVVVDGEGVVAELTERDNFGSIELNVRDNLPPAISNLAVDFEYISPNGDGVQDKATLSYNLSERADIALWVKWQDGFSEEVFAGQRKESGPNTLVWSGEGSKTQLLPDGPYTLILQAKDTSGNMSKATISIVIDTNRLTYRYKNQIKDIRLGWSKGGHPIDITNDGNCFSTQVMFDWPGTQVVSFIPNLRRADFYTPYGHQGGFFPHQQLMIRSGPGGIYFLDLDGNIVRHVPVSYSRSLISPDERYLYGYSEDSLVSYDIETGVEEKIVQVKDPAYASFVISKDGQYLYSFESHYFGYPVPADGNALLEVDLTSRTTRVLHVFHSQISFIPNSQFNHFPLFSRRVGRFLYFLSIENTSASQIYRLVAFDLQDRELVTLDEQSFQDNEYHSIGYEPQEGEGGIFFSVVRDSGTSLYKYEFSSKTSNVIAAELPSMDGCYIDVINQRALFVPYSSLSLWSASLKTGELTQVASILDIWGAGNSGALPPYGHLTYVTPDGKMAFILGDYHGQYWDIGVEVWRVEFAPEAVTKDVDVRLTDVTRPLEDRRLACFEGMAVDPNFKSWRLEYLSLEKPLDGWQVLAEGNTAVNSGEIGCFDTSGLPRGLIIFRLIVLDRAGNVSVFGGGGGNGLIEYYQAYGTIPENIPSDIFYFYNESVPSIYVALPSTRTYYLSPNGDGVLDSVDLSYGLKGRAQISLWVEDAAGNIVSRIVQNEIQELGTYRYSWGGRNSAGAIVPDGEYRLLLQDNLVEISSDVVEFKVILDNTKPSVTLQSPAPGTILSGNVRFIGTVTDANLKEYTVKYKMTQESVWINLATSIKPVEDREVFLWDTLSLTGTYDFLITAQDIAGNGYTITRQYVIDNTLPMVQLLAPAEGEQVFGLVTISVVSTDQDIAEVRFSIKLPSALAWTNLATVNTPPYQTVWDTRLAAFPHGGYQIQALAVDRARNTSLPATVSVFLDKMPPASRLTSPAAGQLGRGAMFVSADSTDNDVARIDFFLRPAHRSGWSFLAEDSSFPFKIVLDTTVYADGVYYLSSHAQDKEGMAEVNPSQVMFRIDNTPPAVQLTSPGNGDSIGGRSDIIGSVLDSNPSSYRYLYCGPLPSSTWVEFGSGGVVSQVGSVLGTLDTKSLVNGTYRIKLESLDEAGNLGGTEVTVTVRNTNPEIIAFATDNEYVSPNGDGQNDLVAISYSISVASFVTLEVSNSRFAQVRVIENKVNKGPGNYVVNYNAFGMDGQALSDGVYVLRLTAADEYGNQTVRENSLTVDSSLPSIAFIQPAPEKQVYGIVDIRAKVVEQNPGQILVQLAQNGSEPIYQTIQEVGSLSSGNVQVLWDSRLLVGAYLLRILAVDKAGNPGSTIIPINVVDPSPALSSMALSQEYTAAAPVNLAFVLGRPGTLSVKILNTNEQAVLTLSNSLHLEPGSHSLAWNLLDITGSRALDGRYRFQVTFTDDITALTSNHHSAFLTIDTVKPEISITAPNSGATLVTTTLISGIINEINFGSYSFTYGAGLAPTQWKAICSSDKPLTTTALANWDITGLSGLYTLMVEAIDLAGNRETASIHYNVAPAGETLIKNMSLSEVAISPNGDGIKDETQVSFDLLGNATLTVWIENVAGLTVAQLAGTGNVPGVPGGKSYTWNGHSDNDLPLEEGVYRLMVKAEEANGFEHIFTAGQCLVDTTPPVLTVSSPASGSTVIDAVSVRGAMVEAHPATLIVSYAKAGSGGASQLAVFHNSPTTDLLAVWDTRGLSGAFNLQLSAEDMAGNRAEKAIPVEVIDGNQPFLSSVTSSTSLISPNGDGYLDNVNAGFYLNRKMEVGVSVKDSNGGVRRTLQPLTLQESGDYATIWNGKGDGGAKLADGDYTLEIIAHDLLSGRSQTAGLPVSLDATPPILNVASPVNGAFVSENVSISGELIEAHPDSAKIYVDSGYGYKELGALSLEGNHFQSIVALRAEDTESKIKVVAADAGGLKTENIVTIQKDTTPPIVTLSLLASATAVSAASPEATHEGRTTTLLAGEALADPSSTVTPIMKGNVTFSFSATDAHLKIAIITYGEGEHPTSWKEICRVTTSTAGSNVTWDTTGIEGIYTLRINAEDFGGNKAEVKRLIDLDNNPPVVSLGYPNPGDFWNYEVYGSVQDRHLLDYTLEYRRINPQGPWVPFAKGQKNISGHLTYYRYPTEKIDEAISIRLSAVDVLGNKAECFTEGYWDNVPPPAPTGLKVSADPNGNLMVSWDPVPATDLSYYNIIRDNTFSTSLVETSYTDLDVPHAKVTYSVTAVDVHWNTSGGASITVDREPPKIELVSPLNEGVYGGLVAIIGTVSADDLAKYVIDVGEGATPDSWQQVKTSTLTKSGETLAYWYSPPRNGTYSIRLKAEDTHGNTATEAVTFLIDNSPPAIPQNVVGELIGNNTVKIAWQRNTETDLKGYWVLLYGNHAHAEIKTDTEYIAANLPDGDYQYSVVAVDQVGNTSQATNPLNISIDTRPPSVTVFSPGAGEIIKDRSRPIPVLARSEDYDVTLVKFQYRADGTLVWSDIGTVVTEIYGTPQHPITLGDIGVSWGIPLLPEGKYWLRSVGTDKHAKTDPNPAETPVFIRIPPSPPTELVGQVVRDRVTLTWKGNAEPDLASYNIYRDKTLVGQIAGPSYSEVLESSRTYQYQVTAVDLMGDESDPSAKVSVIVDLVAPGVTLTSPIDGQKVKGEITISGTIMESSLSSYTLSYSSDNGLHWSEIQTVEFAGSGFSTSWNTSGFNGDYLLGVSAEDTNGNVGASSPVSLFIDNTPPPAPTGLVATAEPDSTATLIWTPSSTQDLGGYNVYAKAGDSVSSRVINTSLVKDPTYHIESGLEMGMVNCLTVTAVDVLGNESLFSEEACVTPNYIQAPRTPLVLYPIDGLQTVEQDISVCGFAAPFSRVVLLKDESDYDSLMVSGKGSAQTVNFPRIGYTPRLSPDGNWVALEGSAYFRNLSTNKYVSLSPDTMNKVAWTRDSSSMIFLSGKSIKLFDVGTQTRRTLVTLPSEATFLDFSVSAFGPYVAYDYYDQGAIQLWVANWQDGSSTMVSTLSLSVTFHPYAWDFNAPRLVFWDNGSVRFYQVDTQQLTSYPLGIFPDKLWGGLQDGAVFYQATNPDSTQTLGYQDFAGGKSYVSEAQRMISTAVLVPWNRSFVFNGNDGQNAFIGAMSFGEEGFSKVTSIEQSSGYNTSDQGLSTSGEVFYGSYGSYQFISVPGRFVFDAVGLKEGRNLLSARGENALGERSPESPPVTVYYDAKGPSTTPNLSFSGVTISPSIPVPNQQAAFYYEISNTGQENLWDMVVTGMMRDAEGTTTVLNGIRPIVVLGLSTAVGVITWTPERVGDYELVLSLTPPWYYSEDDPDDNQLIFPFHVALSGVTADLLLVKTAFQPLELAQHRILLSNPGNTPHTLDYKVEFQSTHGHTYSVLKNDSIALQAGQTLDVPLDWQAPFLPSGDYRLFLEVKEGGNILFEIRRGIAILADGGLEISLVSDKDQYSCGETAALTALMSNASSNAAALNISVDLSISDAGGQEVFHEMRSVPTLAPFGFASEVWQWSPTQCPPLHYAATIRVYRGVVLETTKMLNLHYVEPPASLKLAGTMRIGPRRIARGADIDIVYTLINQGTLPALSQPIAIDVIEPNQGQLLDHVVLNVDCQPSETVVGQMTLRQISHPEGFYVIVMSTEISGQLQMLDQGGFEVADVEPPRIVVTSPLAGSKNPRAYPLQISARVTDNLRGVRSVEYRIDGRKDWSPLERTSGTILDGVYSTVLPIDDWADGDYLLQVRAVDNDGNDGTLRLDDPNPVDISFELINLADVGKNLTVIPRVLVYMESGDKDPSGVVYYKSALQGLEYTIVTKLDSYLRQVKSGSFNVFVVNGRFDEDVIGEATSQETEMLSILREKLFSGAGVLIADWARYTGGKGNAILEEVTGNRYQGRYNQPNLMLSSDAAEYPYVNGFTTVGKATSFLPVKAEVKIKLVDSRTRLSIPTVSSFGLGNGRCMYLGFNPAKSYAQGPSGILPRLLHELAGFVAPQSEFLHPGAVVPIHVSVRAFSDVWLRLTEELPYGAIWQKDFNGGILSNGSVTWSKNLPAGGSDDIRYLVRLPDQGVSAVFVTALSYLRGGVFESVADYPLAVNYGFVTFDEIVEIGALVRGLGLTPSDYDRATLLIQNLISNPLSSANDLKKAADDTLQLIALIRSYPGVGAIRLRLDRLLFSFYRMPSMMGNP